jgi:hypothetical protein
VDAGWVIGTESGSMRIPFVPAMFHKRTPMATPASSRV